QRRINFFHEAPDPIEPKWIEPFDGRSPQWEWFPSEMRLQPRLDGGGDFGEYPMVFLERQPAADPSTVRLVPDDPVPIMNALGTPFLQAIPDDVAALISEPSDRPRVPEWPVAFGKSDHWRCPYINDRLH